MIIGISGRIGSGKDTVGKIIQYLVARKGDERGSKVQTMEFLGLTDSNWNSIYRSQDWKIKKFAGKLKQIVSILTGIPVEDLEKQEVKDRVLGEEWSKTDILPDNPDEIWTPTVRWFLQILGTEAMRNVIHPNVWVNALFADYVTVGVLHEVRYSHSGYPNWLITDMRFPNELQAVKDRGGITIRVNRYCYDSAEDFLVCHPDKNISKIGININMNKNSSVIDFEEPARIHGYIPLSEQHFSETALDNAEFDYVIENNGTINELIEKVRQILNKEKII